MEKKYHISLCALLLLFLTTSCRQSSQQKNESIDEVLNHIAQMRFNYPDSALLLLNTLWNENENRFTDRQKFRYHNLQGSMAMFRQEPSTARDWFLKTLQIAEDMNDTINKIRTIVAITQTWLPRDTQTSLYYFRQAQALLNYQMDVLTIHSVKQGIGTVFALMGQIDLALHYFQIALDAAVRGGFRAGEAISLMEMATLFYKFRDYRQAEKSIRRAIPILRERNCDVNLWISYTNLAAFLVRQDRFEEALSYAQKSGKIANAIGVQAGIAMHSIYNRKGELYFAERKYNNALQMFYQALVLRKTAQNSFLMALSKNAISATYNRLGDSNKAIFYADEALQIAQENESLYLKTNIYRTLAFIHAARGDMVQFEAAMNAKELIRDSLFNQRHITAIQELQIRYETEQKKRLIAYQAETIRFRQTRTVYRLIIGFTVFCIFVLVFISQQRKKQNLTRIVQQYEQLLKYKKKGGAKKTSNLNDTTKKLSDDLYRLFETEKIYRHPKLTINDVVKKLGTNRTYLSQLFNQELRKPFSDFVNAYRVAEAREMLKDDKYTHYTILSISEMVGFSSLSVFYTSFKQEVGVTPAEYRDVIRKIKK